MSTTEKQLEGTFHKELGLSDNQLLDVVEVWNEIVTKSTHNIKGGYAVNPGKILKQVSTAREDHEMSQKEYHFLLYLSGVITSYVSLMIGTADKDNNEAGQSIISHLAKYSNAQMLLECKNVDGEIEIQPK